MRPDSTLRLRSRRNYCCGCAAVFACLVVAFCYFWWMSAHETPLVSIPVPVLPQPNGFDTLNASTALLLDTDKVMYANSTRHDSGLKNDRVYSWTEKQQLIAENAPALALMRKALSQEYLNPPARSFNAMFPYFAKFRAIARLLSLESSVRANRGDYVRAAGSGLDAMELGEKIPRGSVLIGGLVGLACQAIGRPPLTKIVDRLTPAQARTVVERIEQQRRDQAPFADIMQEEKWFGQSALLEAMRQPNGVYAMMQPAGTPVPSPSASRMFENVFYLFYSKRRILHDYTLTMDAEIARAKQPYGTKLPPSLPTDPIVEVLMPTYTDARCQFAKVEAQNSLLELRIALRIYRLDHGTYPTSLNALVPSLVPRLPADPFAKSGTFRYRPTGKGFVLYSIGPDGNDDGGKPVDSGIVSKSNSNQRYLVRSDSKGDIVSGVNDL